MPQSFPVNITITAGFWVRINGKSDVFVPLDDEGNVQFPINAKTFIEYCEKYPDANMAKIIIGESERQISQEVE